MGEAAEAVDAERARHEAELADARRRYDALRARKSVRIALALSGMLRSAAEPLKSTRLGAVSPSALRTGALALRPRRIESFAAWQADGAHSPVTLRRIAQAETALADAPDGVHHGWCHVCRQRSQFTHSTSNLREDLACVTCGLNNRLRASVWLFEQHCRPAPDAPIYLTEQVTGLYAVLAKRFSSLQGSEYLGPDVPRGAVVDGVRNESLTGLSFDSAAFDCILSFEVLEHIPDYRQALRECARVLRPGGRMVFSVPFLTQSPATLVRARVAADGSVEHLEPAEYHGDPLSSDGCLCYQHFGWDLLDELRQAGFSDGWACAYWSERFGYLGGTQIQFVAER
jgi:SAM-dependent methyltransferase